ncbi:MAG: iron permease, partial [Bifidobacterium crudilactis]|nr:iron permease [Bifidobacterium crudilactis]
MYSFAKRSMALFAVMVAACAMLLALLPQDTAQAADSGQYATWNDVATAANAQLDAAEQRYENGDTAGASSAFSASYNSVYVASNFAKVVNDTLGSDRQQQLQQQFQSIEQASYTAGNAASVKQEVVALQAALTSDAQQLDAYTTLADPTRYA